MSAAVCKWKLRDVLVAGRRLNGEAWGKTPDEAVRRFAAVKARELKVDVSAAISRAVQDRVRKAEVAS
jgi:hypothetical protein